MCIFYYYSVEKNMGLATFEILVENLVGYVFNSVDNDLLKSRFELYSQIDNRILIINNIEYLSQFSSNNHQSKNNCIDLSFKDINSIPYPIQRRVCQSNSNETAFIQLIGYKIHMLFNIKKRIHVQITNISDNDIKFKVNNLSCSFIKTSSNIK